MKNLDSETEFSFNITDNRKNLSILNCYSSLDMQFQITRDNYFHPQNQTRPSPDRFMWHYLDFTNKTNLWIVLLVLHCNSNCDWFPKYIRFSYAWMRRGAFPVAHTQVRTYLTTLQLKSSKKFGESSQNNLLIQKHRWF